MMNGTSGGEDGKGAAEVADAMKAKPTGLVGEREKAEEAGKAKDGPLDVLNKAVVVLDGDDGAGAIMEDVKHQQQESMGGEHSNAKGEEDNKNNGNSQPLNVENEQDKDDGGEESPMRLDRYGFLITESTRSANASASVVSLARNRQSLSSKNETARQRKRRIRLENLRLEKWVKMSRDWERERTRYRDRFKRRVRKGVPDSFRQKVWPMICGAIEAKEKGRGVYQRLLVDSNDPSLERTLESINRDIGRTFPRHVIFLKENGLGQRALSNVLRAYSALDREVGYCQGMGFVVGLLLGYIPEEDSFWVLRRLMLESPWKMAELYKPGMPGAQLLLFQFEALLDEFVGDVAEHLRKESIVPSMYATQWFITVFAYNFPFDVVVRIWDVFLHEGWEIVFRVAIAIIKGNRKEILSRHFETILEFFRGLPTMLDVEALMNSALKLKLQPSLLEETKKRFVRQQ